VFECPIAKNDKIGFWIKPRTYMIYLDTYISLLV